MDKMHVVTFRSTAHVLGAVTRTAQAGAAIAVDHIATSGILVRDSANDDIQVLIDKGQLQVVEVDYDTRVFYRPQLFAVIGARAEQQDTGVITVAIDGTDVTVTLPAAVAGATEVFVHVSGGALTEPLVRAVEIADGDLDGSAGLILGSGDYNIVVFAPGYATLITTETLP